jgi:hypothetical protein
MSKQPITLAPDIRPDKPRRNVLPILSLFVAIPLLAPIVIDVVAVFYGQWREVLGTPTTVRTPTLDAIGERVADVREDAWYHISSRFNRVPWNPRVVLPVAVLVIILAMVMLRL